MTSSGRLPLQGWMTAPDTRAVVEALTADGAEVRFIGGSVRDAVLGRVVQDIDLATPDPPEAVISLLQRAGIRAVPTGFEHGTVTAVMHGKRFEVTTLRQDVETFGRHARVAFTADWQADASRRDFTINALSCTPDGRLFDPFGGVADLKAGRVRFIEDARKRIEEDRLRLLRFFRFHAHYGRGAPDRDGLEAARALAPAVHALSGERVREELLKLLSAPDPASVLWVMLAEGILQHVLPEATDPTVLQALVQVEPSETRPDALLRLSALIIPDRGAAEAVAERLRLSRAQRERLVGLAGPKLRVRADMGARALRRALYRLGAERVRDLVMLDWARCRAGTDAPPETDLATALAEVARWTAKSLPVTGSDVTALGVPPGRDVGRLLAELEAWWEGEDFEPSRTACLRRLRMLVRRHKGKA